MPFFFYGFYGFSLLLLAAQVFFCVHAFRSGRPGWIFIILFVPMAGTLIYLFVEYLPEMRARNTVGNAAQKLKDRINPAGEIQRLEDAVALSNSLNNRMALARGYLRVGRADDAIALYRDSLVGLYADDPRLLFELAAAYHARGDQGEARETFEKLRATGTLLSNEHLLLSAVVYEHADDLEGAAREYAALLQRPVIGEEERCRYALVLKRLGRTAEANALFDAIVRHARLSPAHYRKAERAWIDIAKKELASEPVASN